MKKIATKKTVKGQMSVTLDVYNCDNVLKFADKKNNYYKILHIPSYAEAERIFYDWTLQMYKIRVDITLF